MTMLPDLENLPQLAPQSGDKIFIQRAEQQGYADASALGGGNPERFMYGTVLLSIASRDSTNQTFGSTQRQRSNKDIMDMQSGNIPIQYFNCFREIRELSGLTEVRKFTDLRFVDQTGLREYLIANMEIDEGGLFVNDIQAVVYDVIDPTIKDIKCMNMGNRLYQTMRGRHHDKRNMGAIADNLSVNAQRETYQAFIQGAIRLLPGMGSYVYDAGDAPRSVIRTPANRRNRYNLLNDESTVNFFQGTGRRMCINGGSFDAVPFVAPYSWEILHSQSYYVDWDGTLTGFNFTLKTNFGGLIDRFRQASTSVCMLYMVHYLDGAVDKYALYMKPVGADVLYLSQYDQNYYELYAVVEQNDAPPKLRNIYGDSQEMQLKWNKTRLSKGQRNYMIGNDKRNYNKSSKNVKSLRFMLRDTTTGKIGQISKSKFKFVKKRDCPYLPMVVS